MNDLDSLISLIDQCRNGLDIATEQALSRALFANMVDAATPQPEAVVTRLEACLAQATKLLSLSTISELLKMVADVLRVASPDANPAQRTRRDRARNALRVILEHLPPPAYLSGANVPAAQLLDALFSRRLPIRRQNTELEREGSQFAAAAANLMSNNIVLLGKTGVHTTSIAKARYLHSGHEVS
jgi:hypothetical protein